MSIQTSQTISHGLFIAIREPVERSVRLERRIKDRIERGRAREHTGTVRLRLQGRSPAERLQRELPREVMKWSRARTLRIIDLIVPEVEPVPGAMFTAHGRRSNRAIVFVHCRIRDRGLLQRATTVDFKLMGPLP